MRRLVARLRHFWKYGPYPYTPVSVLEPASDPPEEIRVDPTLWFGDDFWQTRYRADD